MRASQNRVVAVEGGPIFGCAADRERAAGERAKGKRLKIAYFTLDPADSNARWRCRSLGLAGADVTQFTCELADRTADLSGETYKTITVGKARKRSLVSRFPLMLRFIYLAIRNPALFRDTDVFMCRNLDMALPGYFLSWIFGGARVYEVIDVHPLCTRGGLSGRLVRRLDRAILRKSSLLVTSSPGFMRSYFNRLGFRGVHVLMENKVRGLPLSTDYWRNRRGPIAPFTQGRPLVVGFFGKIRCAESVEILTRAAKRLDGRLQVVFAGVPEAPVREALQAATSCEYISVKGAYRNPEDLEALYRGVHMSWCVDLSDAKNGAWLLPNRLYESSVFGIPMLTLAGTETSRVARQEGLGVCLESDLEDSLVSFVEGLTDETYSRLVASLKEVPISRFLDGDQHKKLVGHLINACRTRPMAFADDGCGEPTEQISPTE